MPHYGKHIKKIKKNHMQHRISPITNKFSSVQDILDVKEFEHHAQNKLPKNIASFFSGGAGEEITLEENVSAFDSIKLLPRVLKNVDKRSLSTKVLNEDINFPLLIAPMAFQQLAHPKGEIAVAKAAHEHNIIMVLSTLSTTSFKEVRSNVKTPLWFQLYIYRDRKITENLIQLAESSGYTGIVLTVDAPLYGKRAKEICNPLALTSEFEIKNLQAAGLNLKDIPTTKLTNHLTSLLDPSISWDDMNWLRSVTSLPIILKGIMNPKDIQIAIEHNIDAIIISNHGGRQLDTSLSSIDTLKLIRDSVEEKLEIILDGGIRKGIDILKAIALGAKAVMVGRPILWGLTVDGEEGVKSVLTILKSELDLAMALCGYTSISQINEDILFFSR